MHHENRRSFVKKSLATSVSISFAGLIRAAHGEQGTTSENTGATTDPWSNQTTADPWSGQASTFDPWTDDPLGLNQDITTGGEWSLPTDYTVDQWSAWSIDPVTDPVTDNRYTFLGPCHLRNPPESHQWGALEELSTPIYLGNRVPPVTVNFRQVCTKCSFSRLYIPTP
jgi:hypothetical protein